MSAPDPIKDPRREEIRARQRSRSVVLAIALLAFAILMFAITIARMGMKH